MFPTGTKSSSTRKIIFSPNNGEYKYNSTITSISTSQSLQVELGKVVIVMFLSYVKINDGVSELIFKNNSELENVTLGTKSTHSVYYLDQFTFTISDS